MNTVEEYIAEYVNGFAFAYTGHVSKRVFDVKIEVDVFEYNGQSDHREKAHVVFEKGDLKYECDFYDRHHYERDFFPVVLNGRRFICFRKALYGFTLLCADTLVEEYAYFPEAVLHGDESFIVTDVKQLDELLLFEGCYWACPYECFVFDYEKKLFMNVCEMCNVLSLEETVLQDGKLVILGTDENDSEVRMTVSKQDILLGISKNGETDF